MFALPTVGFAYSKNEHNVRLDVLCDWIEGSVLLLGDEVSDSDVVDALRENEVYASQVMAWDMVGNAWRELKRRIGWLGAGSPIVFSGRRLKRLGNWGDAPAHAFCLVLSFAKWYPDWAKTFGKDFTAQGELFESVTIESLRLHFPNWEIHATGWSRSKTSKIKDVVANVAAILGEPVGDVNRWTKASANEAGLDVLCLRSFDDLRAATPVLLLQCASGKHYEGKLHTPSLRIWKRIVEFTTDPAKAFSTPFALVDVEFTRVANLVNGMLLDRYRLLSPSRTKVDWVSPALHTDLAAWIHPRLDALPLLK